MELFLVLFVTFIIFFPCLLPVCLFTSRKKYSMQSTLQLQCAPDGLADAHRRRHQYHAVATHKQHRNGALGRLVHFLVGFLVDFDGGHRFFSIAQHHVQMLIEGLPENEQNVFVI